jgi:hypothetical protein
MNLRDTFNDRNVKLNGRVKLDGRTLNATERLRVKLDGYFHLNGRIKLDGKILTIPAVSTVRLPVRLGRGILDRLSVSAKMQVTDVYTAHIKLNGAIRIDGSENLSGFGRINDRLKVFMRYCHNLNGQYRLDGSIKLNSGIPIAV